MKDQPQQYEDLSLLNLFLIFFKINSLTFGGGYTIIAMIRDEFVKNRMILSDEEMLDISALAQSSPGAMAISTSLLTGYRLLGPAGALVCALASALPCIIILTVISHFYDAFKDSFYLKSALRGMSGVISAVLLLTVYDLGRVNLQKRKGFSLIIMVSAFILGYFTSLHTGLIILLMAFSGLFITIVEERVGGN